MWQSVWASLFKSPLSLLRQTGLLRLTSPRDLTDASLSSDGANVLRSLTSNEPFGVSCMHKSLDSAATALRAIRFCDPRLGGSDPIVQNFYAELTNLQYANVSGDLHLRDRYVVAMEGLAGSGVTTVIQEFRNSFRCNIATAEAAVLEAQSIFESIGGAVWHAYNFVCLHSVVKNTNQFPANELIFIDSFYHKICVNLIVKDVQEIQDLNKILSCAFKWPIDLPIPLLVIYIAVSPEARASRGILTDSQSLGESKQMAYSMVTGPAIMAIDGSGSKSEVAALLEELLSLYTSIPLLRSKHHIKSNEIASELPMVTSSTENGLDNLEDNFPVVGSYRSPYKEKKKQEMSRRSSAGIYNAFADIKMDWK